MVPFTIPIFPGSPSIQICPEHHAVNEPSNWNHEENGWKGGPRTESWGGRS